MADTYRYLGMYLVNPSKVIFVFLLEQDLQLKMPDGLSYNYLAAILVWKL